MKNPWKGVFELPREVWVLSLATFVNRVGTMALPFLTLYLTRELGYSKSQSGLMLSLYGLAALGASLVSGWASDKKGPVPVMKLSLILSGLVLLTFPLWRGTATIIALIVLWSATAELFRPACMAAVGIFAKPEQHQMSFALVRFAINLGMSVGPAVGGHLAQHSFPLLFYVDAVTSLLAGIPLAFYSWGATVVPSSPSEAAPRTWGSILSKRPIQVILLATTLIAVVMFQTDSTQPLFIVDELKLPISSVGTLVFTVNTVLIILLEIPINAWIQRWPSRILLSAGAALFAAGFGMLAWVTGPIGLVISTVVWTFGEMILFPVAPACLSRSASRGTEGKVMALFSLTFGASFFVGPALGSWIYDQYGPGWLWGSMFGIGMMSALFYLAWREK